MSQPVLVVVTFDGGSCNHVLMEMAAIIDLITHDADGKPIHRRRLVRKQMAGSAAMAEAYAIFLALHSMVDTTINHCVENKVPMYLVLRGDNEYALKGATIWSKKWKRENYAKRKHADLWKSLHALLDYFEKIGTIKVGSQSTDYDTGPASELHNFCHDVIQELRNQNGKEELCSLDIDHAPKFEFDADQVEWYR